MSGQLQHAPAAVTPPVMSDPIMAAGGRTSLSSTLPLQRVVMGIVGAMMMGAMPILKSIVRNTPETKHLMLIGDAIRWYRFSLDIETSKIIAKYPWLGESY